MCVIITSPGREERPSLRQLELCERANPHGSGLAWLEGRMVRYAKHATAREIHRHLRSVAGPVIVHFRIASVGGIRPELCHPFPVTHRAELRDSGRARAVLFHNGTWREYSRVQQKLQLTFGRREPVSDTRVAASVVARFGFDWLRGADYCRWAYMNGDGILRLGRWSKIGGCHYSNLHWMPQDSSDFWELMDVT